jgi:hypothetical protein
MTIMMATLLAVMRCTTVLRNHEEIDTAPMALRLSMEGDATTEVPSAHIRVETRVRGRMGGYESHAQHDENTDEIACAA